MDETRSATVLLVEDNPDHAMLAMRAFKKGNLAAEVFWVKDGQEALDFLERHGRWAEPGAAPRPGLVVLDIHLPKVNGHEVLRRIKNDSSLRTIPVVMLTTSARPDDLAESYGAGANSYVTKPVSAKIFVDHLESLKLYWLFTNAPPAA